MMRRGPAVACVLALSAAPALAAARRLESTDYYKMRAVTSVQVSPDGSRAAYTVQTTDGPGRPRTQLWVMALPEGAPVQIGGPEGRGSDPNWSPDGRWIAYAGSSGDKDGLMIVPADGGAPRALADTAGTNSPLTFEGRAIAWSPDSKQIAFVSATPGPETELASGDPVVITRYLYKPDAAEGHTRFNDNRRRHIFVVDAAGGTPRALTTGTSEEQTKASWRVGDIRAEVAELRRRGVEILDYDEPGLKTTDGVADVGFGLTAWFTDPSGNMISLLEFKDEGLR